MPIYEYECGNSHRFEVRQRFSDDPVTSCPTCDGDTRRVIRAVPVHFKGSGFYVNDYGRGAAGPAKDDDAKDSTSEPKEAASEPKETASAPKEPASTSAPKETSTASAGTSSDSGDT